MLKPGDASFRLLLGTTAKLDRNMFCFILSNSFTHTHTHTHTVYHADIRTEAPFRHMYRGEFFSPAPESTDSFSDLPLEDLLSF